MGGVLKFDWRHVTGKTLEHLHGGVERRQLPLPVWRDAHGALPVTPVGVAELIMVAVSDGIQPCAGPYFEKPKRQARLLGDLQEPANEHTGPAHLIRLRR